MSIDWSELRSKGTTAALSCKREIIPVASSPIEPTDALRTLLDDLVELPSPVRLTKNDAGTSEDMARVWGSAVDCRFRFEVFPIEAVESLEG